MLKELPASKRIRVARQFSPSPRTVSYFSFLSACLVLIFLETQISLSRMVFTMTIDFSTEDTIGLDGLGICVRYDCEFVLYAGPMR